MDHQVNDEIRDREVRLVDSDGSQLGIVSGQEALNIAASKDLDLVKIAPQAKPPVCKIMDYGKFRFEQAKKDKEARKRQHVTEVKEVRLSPGIDVHDFDFKQKNARRFLTDGNKVKVSVRFRGRELAHTSLGNDLLKRFAEGCEDIATVEKAPKLEGRFMNMFLAPRQAKAQ